MKRIAVFCGSSSGSEEIYREQALLLGKLLAEQNIGLVYGGARIGLMGAVADGVLDHGGEVTGVLPNFLGSKEIAHDQLTELIMVDSMHERKLKMHDLSDGFIALPGGFGTFEELFEILTWAQLGLHSKPIGLLNVNRFYDPLYKMLETMVSHGFLKPFHQSILLLDTDMRRLLERMYAYEAPPVPKWISREKT
jgi:uncharacterized protein (TIGR00730 family)